MEIQAEEKKNMNPAYQQAAAATFMASTHSVSSSPSHEFSFTDSLYTSTTLSGKTKAHQPPFAIDLSPADDIFFHGHLLPLHLLPDLSTLPRSSINSIDNFTVPITELLGEEEEEEKPNISNSSNGESNSCNDNNQHNRSNNKGRSKNKSFSLLDPKRWRSNASEAKVGEASENQKRKLKFDFPHFLKRYIRMVRAPLMFFRGRKEDIEVHRQVYSFSENLCRGDPRDLRRRRGESSAPASMWTSPGNSGRLLAKAGLPSPTVDSTMEELQAAIQAAIAHCKKSIAPEEKLKS
ncbi:hypothetical protein Nepgr_005881 [Nepenthes gracilis]|uniref:BRI1 kinase inhibitor 1-like n=1 Tax=Nepenthes gracilis TaxID=150966 RepID=A0AAD3S403_NEPGR|nr:hypothetical protein Nepgr_005881 [Nepenthes gracilis]